MGIKSRAVVVIAQGAEPVVGPVEWAHLIEDEILVDIAFTGICHTDLSCASGQLPSEYPVVLGHEAAGVVAEVGPAARTFRPGDRVVISVAHHCGHCRYCEDGRPALCISRGLSRARLSQDGRDVFQAFGTGTFARQTVVREISLVTVPDDVPLRVAAVTGCAVVTGLGAAVNDAQVTIGSTVAVFGCGGVGLSAVMGAHLMGAARIIAIDPDARRRAVALEAGATHVAAPGTEELQVLAPAGVDYALEATGNVDAMRQAVDSTGPAGTIVLMGLPGPAATLAIPVLQFTGRAQRLIGSNMGGLRPNIDFPRYFELYVAGRLPLDLLASTTVPLEEAAHGFELAREGSSVRVLLSNEA